MRAWLTVVNRFTQPMRVTKCTHTLSILRSVIYWTPESSHWCTHAYFTHALCIEFHIRGHALCIRLQNQAHALSIEFHNQKHALCIRCRIWGHINICLILDHCYVQCCRQAAIYFIILIYIKKNLRSSDENWWLLNLNPCI